MPVPWIQIVQWVPSILELSKELLNRSRRLPPAPGGTPAIPQIPQIWLRGSRPWKKTNGDRPNS